MADATALLKAKAATPLFLLHSREFVKRFEILHQAILPAHHDLNAKLLCYRNRPGQWKESFNSFFLSTFSYHLCCTRKLASPYLISATNKQSSMLLWQCQTCTLFSKKNRNEDKSWLLDMKPTFLRNLNINLKPTVQQVPLPP